MTKAPLLRLAGLIALACATGAPPLQGQLRYGGELSLATRYEWRGITRVSGASLQAGLFAGVGGELRLSGGAWTQIQLAARDPERGIGFGRRWFGEVSPWTELSFARGAVDLAVGWTAYVFDLDGAATPEPRPSDTHELYGRVRLVSLPVALPSLTWYQDVDAFAGGYLEAAVSLRLPLWPRAVIPLGSLFLTARAGVSLGQESDASGPGHFAESGLTRWDLSVAFPMGPLFAVGPLELAPVLEGHLQLNRDPVGRIKVLGGSEDGATFWFRFGLSAGGPRCRPEREVCAR